MFIKCGIYSIQLSIYTYFMRSHRHIFSLLSGLLSPLSNISNVSFFSAESFLCVCFYFFLPRLNVIYAHTYIWLRLTILRSLTNKLDKLLFMSDCRHSGLGHCHILVRLPTRTTVFLCFCVARYDMYVYYYQRLSHHYYYYYAVRCVSFLSFLRFLFFSRLIRSPLGFYIYLYININDNDNRLLLIYVVHLHATMTTGIP